MWYSNNPLAYLLTPLSGIYRGAMAIRRWLYRHGVFKTTQFNIPVIVVGNISVGGTGKTPLIISLASIIKQKGYQAGIVSRGYGGKAAHYPFSVTATSAVREAGDEAVMLAQQTGLPMVVAPDRVAAVKKLINDHQVDIVLADDGLQHLALGRAIEIAVIDGERGLGNGFCLPAGPLREPWQRLKSVDFMIINGPGQSRHGLHMHLVPGKPIQLAKLEPGSSFARWQNSNQVPVLRSLDSPVHAVAGIGHPERFFNTLKQLGYQIIPHSFPDHHQFKPKDLDFKDDLPVIMTAKDAVKCQSFAEDNWWVLPVTAQLPQALTIRLLHNLAIHLNKPFPVSTTGLNR